MSNIALALSLAVSLSQGIMLVREQDARFGTMMEVKPVRIHQDGGLLQTNLATNLWDSLYQNIQLFMSSVMDFVSSTFRQEVICQSKCKKTTCLALLTSDKSTLCKAT